MKKLLKERFQELAGIKPLYEGRREPHPEADPDNYLEPRVDGNEKVLSPQSNEWLKDQINMYFEGGDEPGTPGEQGEFEITRIEQGDPQKYDDADLAQKFLEELRGLGSMVVRFDEYIGDIKVTSDGEGGAIVTWVWPEGIDENDRFPGEDEAGMAPRHDEEFELEDNEKDYLTDVTIEFHKKLNPTLDVNKSKSIMDFVISQLEEMY
jgi:hypothetical protein